MARHPGIERKLVLNDPVAAYSNLFPDSSARENSTLCDLWQKLQAAKLEYNETHLLNKKISRKIGQAKQDGAAVDQYVLTMRTNSTVLKSLGEKIREYEAQILGLFDLSLSQPETKQPGNHDIRRQRHYAASLEDIDTVSVVLHKAGDENWTKAWDDYTNENPAASIYHRHEWMNLIQDTQHQQGYYFSARNNQNSIVGILPLLRLKSRLFGDFMVSMPYFNYGGAIADHPGIEQQLMLAANAHAVKLGISHIEYRDDVPREEYPERTDKVNMILELPDTCDKLWNSFTSKLRSQIRRPQRENPTAHSGGEELLDQFYDVFARNMRDIGTPVYAKKFFRSILRTFPDNSRIMIVRMGQRPVAAGFLLGHRNTLEIPWASTIRDVNHLSINMFFYWEVLKSAVEQGYKYFDFGRSSKGVGTYRFKQQWGARPKQLFWHYWLAEGQEMPALNPGNPRYKSAIRLWKKMPLIATRLIGPYIVRNLP